MNRLTLLFILFGGLQAPALLAQTQTTDPPMTLQEVSDFFADTTVAPADIQLLTQAIARNGISFSLDQKSLESLLAAAKKGRRTDATTALVILQVLRSCPDCRSTYFGPLNREELLFLVKRDVILPHVKEEEVRLRGTRDIPKTIETVRALEAAGATPALIELVVPSDEIEIPAPEGYQPVPLVHSQDYDRRSNSGRLDVSIEVMGKVELLFVNNALFYRTVPSSDKKAPAPQFVPNSSSYSAPGPAMQTFARLESWQRSDGKDGKITKLWDNGKPLSKKATNPPTLEYRADAAPGWNGIAITIEESDRKQAHTHDFRIIWGAEPPAPAKPSLK